MSPSKPLSYEPLKSVLAHIDAVKRFEMSQKMPTIQKTEKLVPLKIDKLSFSCRTLTVNETQYVLYTVIKTDKTSRNMLCNRSYDCLTINGTRNEYLECPPGKYSCPLEYLKSLFFGGRINPALVKNLLFNTSEWFTWPQNTKIQIQHLTIKNGIRDGLKKLSALLTNTSFSLQSLKIFVDSSTAEEFRDEVVQEANKVVIAHNSKSYFTMGAENWNFLPADTHFESTHTLAPDNFVALIRNWKVSEAAPGRRCSVGLSNNTEGEQFGIETILKVQEQFDVVKENEVINIPINQSSEVHVSVRNYDGPQDNNDPPMLVMEVVAKM